MTPSSQGSEPPDNPDRFRESSPNARWRVKELFDPHRSHQQAGGWYAAIQSARADPGPAIHPTRHLPDLNWFKGSAGGKIVKVEPTGGKIPSDYAPWAGQHQLDSNQFWLYIVAAAHHRGYWTEGHPYAQQLLDQQTMPPLSDDPDTIKRLIDLGQQLLEAWSVDKMTPVKHSQDSAGVWTFDGEDAAEAIVLHGRDVLAKWRDSRSIADKTGWSKTAAEQYARVIAALLATDRIADEVADLLGEPEQPEGG